MKFWQHPLIRDIGPVQFGSLFSTTPVSAVGMMVNATIMALALLQATNWVEAGLWWATNIACALYALYRWHKNKSRPVGNPTRGTSKKTVTKLIVAAALFAAPWAYLLIAYIGQLPPKVELVMVAVVAGMTASGSIHLSRIYPAAIAFLAIMTLTGALTCFYQGTMEYFLLGSLILSYGAFLNRVVKLSSQLSIDRTHAMRALEEKVEEMDNTRVELKKFAMEDPLTQLANRREFQARLTKAVSEAAHHGTSVALLVCDLDHFKNINDISGHHVGDELLKLVAERLRTTVRDYDLVARIGGDEFAIIAEHHKSPKDTADFTRRLLNAIKQPAEIDGRMVTPGISVGISMFPFDARDTKTLLAHGDRALQLGKAAGRGQFNFFDQKMKTQLTFDEAMESDLRIAMVEEEFELFYQPKVSIRTGQLQGFEALLRWHHPEGKVLSPPQFFNVAEERGLMPFISDFVVERALCDIKSWNAKGLEPGTVSFNIHPVQIKDDHRMKRIVRDIERAGINPEKIFLEITEGCIVGRGTEEVPKIIEYLRNRGLQISLDDFGTGFASLAHLKDLAVDELKFDRSFISDLLTNSTNRAIVNSMVKLANSLGMKTVAEGVETSEQHNVLLAMGCSTGQGYFYNKPLSYEEATDLIANSQLDDSQNVSPLDAVTSRQIINFRPGKVRQSM